MTDEEVNKIIAEYMGWYQKKYTHAQMWFKMENTKEISEMSGCIGDYTKSLDALVPVWRKMPKYTVEFITLNMTNNIAGFENKNLYTVSMNTIQQAASHATAKAIQELDNG